MATLEQLETQKEAFGIEWDGKFSIWGYCIGAAPNQYDEYGRPPRGGPKDYGFHVYTSDKNDIERIPNMWNGIPVMVFVDIPPESDD